MSIFERFYDFANDALTADVDNTSVTTDVLNNTTIYLESPVTQTKLSDAQSELSDGGEIIVPEGVHTGRFGISADDITLRGRSKQATLKLPDNTDAQAQVLTVEGQGVTVERMTIDGNNQNNDVSGVADSGACDAIANYSSDNTFRDLVVQNALAHGIITWGQADSGSARHNATNISVTFERCTDVTVDNCRFVDCGSPTEERAALDFAYGVDEFRATGNVVEGGPSTGVGITSHGTQITAGVPHEDATIANNIVLSPVRHGYVIRDALLGGSVTGNVAIGFGDTGIIAVSGVWEDCVVNGNTFRSTETGAQGIYHGSDSGLVNSNLSGNTADVPAEAWLNDGSIDSASEVGMTGYTNANKGSSSIADGGTIAHGLDGTPDYVNLTTTTQGHVASASAVDGTNITVQLVDDTGSAVGTAETVYWEAKLANAA